MLSCSLILVNVPSISFTSSWETSFLTSCAVLVTILYWASIAGNFCLIFWNKCFEKYFKKSIYAFMGDTSLFSRDKRYILQLSIVFITDFSEYWIFQMCENCAKGYHSAHLNVIWNYTERNILWDSVLELYSRNVPHRIQWFILAIAEIIQKTSLVKKNSNNGNVHWNNFMLPLMTEKEGNGRKTLTSKSCTNIFTSRKDTSTGTKNFLLLPSIKAVKWATPSKYSFLILSSSSARAY